MAHPDDYQYYLDSGCSDVSYCLGIQSMPEGFSLMLDADGMFFFWMERATGVESSITCSKWSAYHGARKYASAAIALKDGEVSD